LAALYPWYGYGYGYCDPYNPYSAYYCYPYTYGYAW
jgi:hypothetical protein